MIYDDLKRFKNYKKMFGKYYVLIEDFINKLSASTPDGRYELDGDNLYASVQSYTTKPLDEGKLEIHHRYLDIQLLVFGNERILAGSIENLPVLETFDSAKDCGFYKVDLLNTVELPMKKGKFAVFCPFEGHMPCIAMDGQALSAVKKVVIKMDYQCKI